MVIDSIMMGCIGHSFTVLTCTQEEIREDEWNAAVSSTIAIANKLAFEILITTSMPDVTLPKTGCFESPVSRLSAELTQRNDDERR
jgi:hypothetical protein